MTVNLKPGSSYENAASFRSAGQAGAVDHGAQPNRSKTEIDLNGSRITPSTGNIGAANRGVSGNGKNAGQSIPPDSLTPASQAGNNLAQTIADTPVHGYKTYREALLGWRNILPSAATSAPTSTATILKNFREALDGFMTSTPTAETRNLYDGLIKSTLAMPFLQAFSSVTVMDARGSRDTNNMPDCVQPFLDSLDALLHETDPEKRKAAVEDFMARCDQFAGMTKDEALLKKMSVVKDAAGKLAGLLEKELVWIGEFDACLDRTEKALADGDLAGARNHLDAAKKLHSNPPSAIQGWGRGASSLAVVDGGAVVQPPEAIARRNALDAELRKEETRKAFEGTLNSLSERASKRPGTREAVEGLRLDLSDLNKDLDSKRGILGDAACEALKARADEIEVRLDVAERLLGGDVSLHKKEKNAKDNLTSANAKGDPTSAAANAAAECLQKLKNFHQAARALAKDSKFARNEAKKEILKNVLKAVKQELEQDFQNAVLAPFVENLEKIQAAKDELSAIDAKAAAASSLSADRRKIQNDLDVLMDSMDKMEARLSGAHGALLSKQLDTPAAGSVNEKQKTGHIRVFHKELRKLIAGTLDMLNEKRADCENLWMESSFLKRRFAILDRTAIDHLGKDSLPELLVRLSKAQISGEDRAALEKEIKGGKLSPESCRKLNDLLGSSLPGKYFRDPGTGKSLKALGEHSRSKSAGDLPMTEQLAKDLLWALRLTITPEQYKGLTGLAGEMSKSALDSLTKRAAALGKEAGDDPALIREFSFNLRALDERAGFNLLEEDREAFRKVCLTALENAAPKLLELGKKEFEAGSGMRYNDLPPEVQRGFDRLCSESWCDWRVTGALSFDPGDEEAKNSRIRILEGVGRGGADGVKAVEELLRDLPEVDDLCLELEISLAGTQEERGFVREYEAYRGYRDLREAVRELADSPRVAKGARDVMQDMLKLPREEMIQAFLALLENPDKAPCRVDDIDLLVINAHFLNELAKRQNKHTNSIFKSMRSALPEPYHGMDPKTLRTHLESGIPGTRMVKADARKLHSMSKSLFRSGRLMNVVGEISLPPEQARAREIIATAAINVLGFRTASGKSPEELWDMLSATTIPDRPLAPPEFFEELAGLMATTLGIRDQTAKGSMRAQLAALNERCGLFDQLRNDFVERNNADALALAVIEDQDAQYAKIINSMYPPSPKSAQSKSSEEPKPASHRGSHCALGISLISLLCDPKAKLGNGAESTWEKRRDTLAMIDLEEMVKHGGRLLGEKKNVLKFKSLFERLKDAKNVEEFSKAAGAMREFLNEPPVDGGYTPLEKASAILYFKESAVKRSRVNKTGVEIRAGTFIKTKMGTFLNDNPPLPMDTTIIPLLIGDTCRDVIRRAQRKYTQSLKEKHDKQDNKKIQEAGKATEKTLSPYCERIFDNLAAVVFMQQFIAVRGYNFAQAAEDARTEGSPFRNECLESMGRLLGIPAGSNSAKSLLDNMLKKINPGDGIDEFAAKIKPTMGHRIDNAIQSTQDWLNKTKAMKAEEKRETVSRNIDSLVGMVGKNQILNMNANAGGTISVGLGGLHEELADVRVAGSLDFSTGVNIAQLPDGSYVVNVLEGAKAAVGVEASMLSDTLQLGAELRGGAGSGLQFVFAAEGGKTDPRERVKSFLQDLLSGAAGSETIAKNYDRVATLRSGSVGVEFAAGANLLALAKAAREKINAPGADGDSVPDLVKAEAEAAIGVELNRETVDRPGGKVTTTRFAAVLTFEAAAGVNEDPFDILPEQDDSESWVVDISRELAIENQLQETVSNGKLTDARLGTAFTLVPAAGNPRAHALNEARAESLARRYGMEENAGFINEIIHRLDNNIPVVVTVERSITREALAAHNRETPGKGASRREGDYVLDRIVLTSPKRTVADKWSLEIGNQEFHRDASIELDAVRIYYPPFPEPVPAGGGNAPAP